MSGTPATTTMARTTNAPVDERFAWTGELIDGVLALRFKDAALAGAIDNAKGNESKRKAWTALATQFQNIHGVNVPETKIRRAISKWQSQHRSWAQTMATKSPAELTQVDRPPTYMPVLQRYFQENSGGPSVETLATAVGNQQDALQPSNTRLVLAGFEEALHTIPPPQMEEIIQQDLSKILTSIPSAASTFSTPSLAISVVARTESALAPSHHAEAPVPPTTYHAPQKCVTLAHMTGVDLNVISQDSDEDPCTSQEDSPAAVQLHTRSDAHIEMPAAKHRKISSEKTIVAPARPSRVSPTPALIPTNDISITRALHTVESTALRDLASRVTQQLVNVQQEQMLLQKKHFNEQLELQRKQYEEYFVMQRKQTEVVQTVLESLQASVAI